MRAVVIGGYGFLGGALVRELTARGTTAVILDNRAPDRGWDDDGVEDVEVVHADITDPDAMTSALEGADEVYHMAGLLGTSELEDDLRGAVHTNVIGSLNVFDAAVQHGVPRVFLASKPNVWLNAYSVTKNAAEEFARIYQRDRGLEIRSLRFFNAYGPRQHLAPVRKMVPAFAAMAMTGQPLEIFGDGEQTVDLIYSSDLARITIDYTRSDSRDTESFDCGRGQATTVNQVASAVAAHFGLADSAIVRVPMRVGETPGTTLVADTTELEGALGPLGFTDLETSLGETLEWYAARPRHELRAAVDYYRAHPVVTCG